jgi:M42 glutamyl aminopeptidase
MLLALALVPWIVLAPPRAADTGAENAAPAPVSGPALALEPSPVSGPAAVPVPVPVPVPLPSLRDFAAPAAPTGSEGWVVRALLPLLPADVHVERDAFGSVIVRVAPPGTPCTRLIAVGLDEPGYVIGQVRDDGYLRLRFLGHAGTPAFHLAHEGRPALVLPRAALPDQPVDAPGHSHAPPAGAAWPVNALDVQPAGRPGVVLVNSIHLKNARPANLDEADLWLDVGADSAADVDALGIGLLDPVVLREITGFGDRVAGPDLGRRAAALALLAALRDVPRAQWRDGLALAFVAQSLPGTGPLGRGGEGLLRRLEPHEALLLAAHDGGAEAVVHAQGAVTGLPAVASAAAPPPDGVTWSTLQLRVGQAGTPVESVAADDLVAFDAALRAEVAR